ncbi:MAG: IS66 family insertion sequence element accessory protein TnpB [Flavisolibacter sp.]
MSTILHLSDHRNYFLYRKETDMRKGFDSLCGIISGELGRQVTGGDAFIFINRPRTHLKLLLWEPDGFTIVYRRLEKGAFEVPQFNLDQDSLQITSDQLHFILKGIKISSLKYRKRYGHSEGIC